MIWKSVLNRALVYAFYPVDKLYLALDRRNVRRTRNIQLIPHVAQRRGGKVAYAEWAYVIGIFQTLIAQLIDYKQPNRILDVGCGTGLLGIASLPMIQMGGEYIGIDVDEQNIKFCKAHYPSENMRFIHLDTSNAAYAPNQHQKRLGWNIKDQSIDLVTALSVWTHFNQEDAIFYFQEIDRVIKPGGIAIITFFLLDDAYKDCALQRQHKTSKYHNTYEDIWIFDQASSSSGHWYSRRDVAIPEHAIGITPEGVEQLLQNTKLKWIDTHPGNWKEQFGLYFQDILIFERM